MPSSRWPTQNELDNVFGGSLFHNVNLGSFFFLPTLHVLCVFIMVSSLGYHGIPEYVNVCVFAPTYTSCGFPLALLLIWLFHCFLICLFIYLFYYHSLDACLFTDERQKQGVPRWDDK